MKKTRPTRSNINQLATAKHCHDLGSGSTATVWLFRIGPGAWQWAGYLTRPGWPSFTVDAWGADQAWPNEYNAHLAALVAMRKRNASDLGPARTFQQLRQLVAEMAKSPQ